MKFFFFKSQKLDKLEYISWAISNFHMSTRSLDFLGVKHLIGYGNGGNAVGVAEETPIAGAKFSFGQASTTHTKMSCSLHFTSTPLPLLPTSHSLSLSKRMALPVPCAVGGNVSFIYQMLSVFFPPGINWLIC